MLAQSFHSAISEFDCVKLWSAICCDLLCCCLFFVAVPFSLFAVLLPNAITPRSMESTQACPPPVYLSSTLLPRISLGKTGLVHRRRRTCSGPSSVDATLLGFAQTDQQPATKVSLLRSTSVDTTPTSFAPEVESIDAGEPAPDGTCSVHATPHGFAQEGSATTIDTGLSPPVYPSSTLLPQRTCSGPSSVGAALLGFSQTNPQPATKASLLRSTSVDTTPMSFAREA